ncbi:MAG: hypothetical protein ACXWXO_06400 [Nocardioides sp.]
MAGPEAAPEAADLFEVDRQPMLEAELDSLWAYQKIGVVAARSPGLMAVAREGGGVRVEVYDESPDPPVVVNAESLMEQGAGLRLVAVLASSREAISRGDPRPGSGCGSRWIELARAP